MGGGGGGRERGGGAGMYVEKTLNGKIKKDQIHISLSECEPALVFLFQVELG